MFRTFNLRRRKTRNLLLFVLIVCALVWYVREKRAEFLKGPVMAPAALPPAVSSKALPKAETDYFVDSKLERERARSLELERLREMINSTQTDAATKKEANSRFLLASKEAARESEIEHLVKARGYDDVVAFLGNGSCVIVVKTAQLSQVDVLRLADVVSQVAGLKPESLRVIARQ